MEERRLGYALFYESKEYREMTKEKRQKEIVLKQSLRPQLMETLAAQKLTLQPIQPQQIIHLTQSQKLKD